LFGFLFVQAELSSSISFQGRMKLFLHRCNF
jgi:hypothetical protein